MGAVCSRSAPPPGWPLMGQARGHVCLRRAPQVVAAILLSYMVGIGAHLWLNSALFRNPVPGTGRQDGTTVQALSRRNAQLIRGQKGSSSSARRRAGTVTSLPGAGIRCASSMPIPWSGSSLTGSGNGRRSPECCNSPHDGDVLRLRRGRRLFCGPMAGHGVLHRGIGDWPSLLALFPPKLVAARQIFPAGH